MAPDVNESYSTFTVVAESLKQGKPRIRFGLKAIRNVGEGAVKSIIKERKNNGNFKSITELLTRVKSKDVNRKSLEGLIKSGSLDAFGERNMLFENIENMLNFIKQYFQEQDSSQESLFLAMKSENMNLKLKLDSYPELNKRQKLAYEKEFLGLYVSEHPFSEFEKLLSTVTVPFSELPSRVASESVKIAGIISHVKKILTKKGDYMAFVKLDSTFLTTEVLVFPKVFEHTKELVVEDKIVLVEGKVSEKEGEYNVLCNSLIEITKDNLSSIIKRDKAKKEILIKNEIHITIPEKFSQQNAVDLKSLLSANPGKFQVYLIVNNKKALTKLKIQPTEIFINKIEKLVGQNRVKMY